MRRSCTHQGLVVIRTPMPRLSNQHPIHLPLLHTHLLSIREIIKRPIDHLHLPLAPIGIHTQLLRADPPNTSFPSGSHTGGRLDSDQFTNIERGVGLVFCRA
jgi:hypothetical protein